MIKQSTIGERKIGGIGIPCYVIAELGVNHNGDVDLAMDMVRAAANSGVNAVKIAAYTASEFTTDTPYTYRTLGGKQQKTESQLAMFERLALGFQAIALLRKEAKRLGLHFIVTATDSWWVQRMMDLDVDAFKVGSDDIVHGPLLLAMRLSKKPIILSTGMASKAEIEWAVRSQQNLVAVLHCVSLYPTPPSKANLHRIVRLDVHLPVPIGFSDHTVGVRAAVLAIGMGATVIEKHFTLNQQDDGPDHWFSATPRELYTICETARTQALMIGEGNVDPEYEELQMRIVARRSIVAKHLIPAGRTLEETDLAYRRPGSGLWPCQRDEVLGKIARAAIPAGQQILPSMLIEAEELRPSVTH